MQSNRTAVLPVESFFQQMLGVTERDMLVEMMMPRLCPADAAQARQDLIQLLDTGRCTQAFAQCLAMLAAGLEPWFWRALNESRDGNVRSASGESAGREFKAHLRKITERSVPRLIYLANHSDVDEWLHIPLPASIARFGWQEQCLLVARAIKKAEEEPQDVFHAMFGAVTGYEYRPTSGEAYAVSLGADVDPVNRLKP